MILETAALSEADYIIANHEDGAKEAPLHVASRCGNLEILELLVKHGANICALDAKGRTCLHCAVQSAHNSCLRFLLQIGGKQIIEERDHRGLNCLHIAVKQNCISCVETLLKSGADVTAMTPNGADVLQLAQSQKARKLIDVILRYHNLYQSESHINHDDSDLFQGLEVFQGSRNSPSISKDLNHLPVNIKNGNSQSLSPMTCHTDQTRSNEYQGDSQTESFYFGGHLWLPFFHNDDGCIHPYFLRAFDNHSQVSFLILI
jgi:ankyrin repeat protein